MDAGGYIVASELTESGVDDGSVGAAIIRGHRAGITRFTADGAYDTRAIYEAMTAVGCVEVVIPPRDAQGEEDDNTDDGDGERGERPQSQGLPFHLGDDVSGTVTTPAEADALADCTEPDGLAVHLSAGVGSVDLPLLERVNGTPCAHGASGTANDREPER